MSFIFCILIRGVGADLGSPRLIRDFADIPLICVGDAYYSTARKSVKIKYLLELRIAERLTAHYALLFFAA